MDNTWGRSSAWALSVNSFCESKKLKRQLREVRELIVQRFPDDAETRRALNHVKHGGKWMPRNEYMKSLGLGKDGNSWVTAAVAAARERKRVAKSKATQAEPGVARWQRRLDWLQRRFAAGCTLLLDVPSLLATQPFSTVDIANFYLAKNPKKHGLQVSRVATKLASHQPRQQSTCYGFRIG